MSKAEDSVRDNVYERSVTKSNILSKNGKRGTPTTRFPSLRGVDASTKLSLLKIMKVRTVRLIHLSYISESFNCSCTLFVILQYMVARHKPMPMSITRVQAALKAVKAQRDSERLRAVSWIRRKSRRISLLFLNLNTWLSGTSRGTFGSVRSSYLGLTRRRVEIANSTSAVCGK